MTASGLVLQRCQWCTDDPLYVDYHDQEWGVPLYDDRRLFEMLCLEGAQAGLSWLTVLKKREHYRLVWDEFDWLVMARYHAGKVAELLGDPGIIRNRMKVEAFISNARATVTVLEKYASLTDFLWRYVDGVAIQNQWRTHAEIPAQTAQSRLMSRDLKSHGFKFVGPTICYAFMQSVGMVNDHTLGCFRHQEVQQIQR